VWPSSGILQHFGVQSDLFMTAWSNNSNSAWRVSCWHPQYEDSLQWILTIKCPTQIHILYKLHPKQWKIGKSRIFTNFLRSFLTLVNIREYLQVIKIRILDLWYRPTRNHFQIPIFVLLPSDAVRWRSICNSDVAVYVSVTLMYCAQTTESIIMRPSPDCIPAILVFPYQIWTR